jgi:AraC-like DNA-binding protein
VLDLASSRRDTRLHRLLRGYADAALERLPAASSATGRVLQALKDELQGGRPTLATIAKKVAMSPRTLNRRLAEEGLVFSSLRDSLRKELAESYLRHGSMTVAEVSYLLGFSQPSAFHRAFKRWTGSPPLLYCRGRQAYQASSRSST